MDIMELIVIKLKSFILLQRIWIRMTMKKFMVKDFTSFKVPLSITDVILVYISEVNYGGIDRRIETP